MKTIEVAGIWLRGCGPEHVEVLAQTKDGEWRTVIPSQHIEPGHRVQSVSHIVEPSGIAGSPVSSVTGS